MNTDCRGCKGLPAGMQCNHCRTNNPSEATLRRRAIVETMRETGCTAAEAEAAHGVGSGPVLR